MQQMKPLCKRARINRMSIKESLDNLPSGVCFARENGTLILCNRQMQRLYRRLAGTDLQRLSELRRAVAQPGGGISVLDAGAHILRFPEGRVWQFTESIATDAYGRRYTQALAQDITELADRRARLERENAALLDANARARKLYHELDDMVREEETLAMKMRLHDEIGVGLLSARKALEEGAPLAALQRCGAAWAAIAGIFRTAETGGGADTRRCRHWHPHCDRGRAAKERGSGISHHHRHARLRDERRAARPRGSTVCENLRKRRRHPGRDREQRRRAGAGNHRGRRVVRSAPPNGESGRRDAGQQRSGLPTDAYAAKGGLIHAQCTAGRG